MAAKEREAQFAMMRPLLGHNNFIGRKKEYHGLGWGFVFAHSQRWDCNNFSLFDCAERPYQHTTSHDTR